MLKSIQKIFFQRNKSIDKYRRSVKQINELEKRFEALPDKELKALTFKLKEKLKAREEDDVLGLVLPEAFAAVREASKRTLGQRHFDEQLMAGIALHEGKIIEMKTGEGKTLAATLPVYLNALSGKGVFVVTVNDYLARRDTVWMGQIYDFLGLSVGCVTQEQAFIYDSAVKEQKQLDRERDLTGSFNVERQFLRPCSRKEAYLADITYGTNNVFGFDYLRDNLVSSLKEIVQRKFNYAILDEIDSILIDEARTPLIISSPDTRSSQMYKKFSRIVPLLKENRDYNIDEKMKAVTLTEEGLKRAEKLLGGKNIYKTSDLQSIFHLEQALKAYTIFKKDRDYIVKDGKVIIVDEFTGRLMPDRRYSEGIHQAIEAKEGVEVKQESRTLATITFQNFFRKFPKLAGMTGTALTSAEEFEKVYNLEVVPIPTHKPMIRIDYPDSVYSTAKGKFKAIVREIKQRHQKGQPILVGTVSVEKNEYLHRLLDLEGIPHEILNAKNHEREAQIIAQAGRLGAVTVATNMAGRGVDIVLGGNPPDKVEAEKVKQAGGLFVLGTERHEARRIDDQLRGRSGRQGDPGESRFFVSLEDDLMRVFGSDRIKHFMLTMKIPEDQPIENKMISRAIEKAQARIEGYNFDTRKYVLEYDEVLNKQREAIYSLRREILREAEDKAKASKLRERVLEMIHAEIRAIVEFHTAADDSAAWNIEEIAESVRTIFPVEENLHSNLLSIARSREQNFNKREKMLLLLFDKIDSFYSLREREVGGEPMRMIEKLVLLQSIDTLWTSHLDTMDYLKQGVGLRAYGQRDPLVEYKTEGNRLFVDLLKAIQANVAFMIFKVGFPQENSVPPSGEGPAGKVKKVGRNDPCPCGSGKKYKYCGLLNTPEHQKNMQKSKVVPSV